MAFMPGATLDLLPENATQSKIVPTQVILHTAVDAPGPTHLPRYFARADVAVESHFWIPLTGRIIQMMDTNVRADANRRANFRAISIETEDEGNPVGVPWTKAQVDSIVKIILWAHEEHGIPLDICQSWEKPGIGWHAMWGAPSMWTPSKGKTCPGPTRIAQIHAEVLPALNQEAPPMSYEQAKAQLKIDYPKYAGRKADAGGLDYWAREISEGRQSIQSVRHLLLDSEGLGRIWKRLASLEASSGGEGTTTDEVIEEIIDRLED